jgi:hypothetical protein
MPFPVEVNVAGSDPYTGWLAWHHHLSPCVGGGAAPRVHGDVARTLRREHWAHVGELMCTDSIDADRQAVFVRLTARRARKADQQDVAILEWTG